MVGSSAIRKRLVTAGRFAGAAARAAAEAVFPAKCLACGRIFDPESKHFCHCPVSPQDSKGRLPQILKSRLCPACLIGIYPVASPVCVSCGQVFAARSGTDHLCESCIRSPNYFARARSALVYSDTCAQLVHAFKYGGKIQLAKPLGAILRGAFYRFWAPDEFDLIVPVPLHRRKLTRRGFNQVWLMMRQWSRLELRPPEPVAAAAFDCSVLARARSTRPQTGLGRKERAANLRNAFELTGKQSAAGLRLLVVDDVYTTGATANECARLLCQRGARRVDVLTLARAV